MESDVLSQLWVAWQPIVDLSEGVIVGHEALIRGPGDSPWATPAALFAWAEEEDRAADLEQACRTLALVQADADWEPGRYLFLNVDGRWPRLPDPWEHRGSTRAPLVLELSERHSVLDNPPLLEAVARWRAAGHLLALDDYGTGYAGAATVLAIHPHFVKLDRALIADIDRSFEKRSLVKALRVWTRDLGIQLVAEGIETAAELAVLQDLGCDYGQGFLWGRPEPKRQTRRRKVTTGRLPVASRTLVQAEPALGFYAEAIRTSPIPSYVVDARRRMVAWNQAAAQLLGFTAEDLVGHTCDRSPLDHRDQAGHRLCVGACPVAEAMAGRTPVRERVSARSRTGPRRIITVAVVPLIDSATGRVVGALEQFRLAPGWEDAPDRGDPADGADDPHPVPPTDPRSSMDTPAY